MDIATNTSLSIRLFGFIWIIRNISLIILALVINIYEAVVMVIVLKWLTSEWRR